MVAASFVPVVMGVSATAATVGGSSSPGSAVTTPTRCGEALRERLTRAPRILGRIEASIRDLRERAERVRSPGRRALLEQRIERLEALRNRLTERIERAQEVCGIT
jgi:chromosome segregation ATPase